MNIVSKTNGREVNNIKLNKVEPIKDKNIPEAMVETIFEKYLQVSGWGDVGNLYTKRRAKNEAYDKFPSKRKGIHNGAPDYILYENDCFESKIIAVGDVKSPKDSSSEYGLDDGKYYIERYNSLHEHKIRIAFGFDGVDFKIEYLKDVTQNIWESIYIDTTILTQLPPPKFMRLISDFGNYFTTNREKSVSKEMLEPYFAKCDTILRHTKLSSSPIDKAIEISIFIFLKRFSENMLDKEFKNNVSAGKSVWELVEGGYIEQVNTAFVTYLNTSYSNVFPEKIISVERDDSIKLAEIINLMFKKCDIHDLTDVKGNALEYFQKDSKDKKIGEFFTPRHIVDLIVYLISPKIIFKQEDGEYILDENGDRIIEKAEKIYDPACGSGGFLIQAFNWYLSNYGGYGITADKLKTNVIFGTELKEKTVMLTKLNMILLGDGHNNIVRNSSISYISSDKMIRLKKDNKYIEIDPNDIIPIKKQTKFGVIYTHIKKDTGEPVVEVKNSAKYFLAEIDKETNKLRRITKNNKFVKCISSEVIPKTINDNGEERVEYYQSGTNIPVIKIGSDSTKYYLAKIKMGKDNIPERQYVSIKAVNEAVKKEHSPNFGKFDVVMANHPYGLEEPSKPEQLFIEHMLESLRKGGRIGCVVGENLLFDDTYLKFRRDMQKNYTIEGIISLPQGVFLPYTDVKTSILLIKKEISPKGHKTWLVEVTADGYELTSSRNKINDNDFPKLKNLWNRWGGSYLSEVPNEGLYQSFHREEKGFAEFHELSPKNWCVKRYNVSQISLNSKYDLVSLMEILKRDKHSIHIKDNEKYSRITIQVQNRGVIKRDEEYGYNIGTKTQFKVKAGQFIISKIDARNGAYGIVPKQLEGAIITNNFWTFDINTERIYPEYLEYLMLNEYFFKVCDTCSYGSTNRWYLDEDTFNNFRIPLPNKLKQKEILNNIKMYKEIIKKAEQDILEAKNGIKDLIGDLLTNEEKVIPKIV